MSFFEKVGKQINVLREKSEDVSKLTRLKMERSKQQSEIKEKIKELGQIVYESYISDSRDSDLVLTLCEDIKSLENRIQEINNEINMLNPDEIKCPNCGQKVLSNQKFCSSCAFKLAKED